MKELVVKLILVNAKTKCKTSVYEEIIPEYACGKKQNSSSQEESQHYFFGKPHRNSVCLCFPND